MYRHLYDSFKHWFHGGRGHVFFYSDPHFCDDKTTAFRKKKNNFIPDEEQLRRINSKIGKYDTIVILGDIGSIRFSSAIRGYKVLILGNHDRGISNYRRQIYRIPPVIDPYDNHLFDEVYEGCLTISDKIILSHEPIDFPYALNIHGHKHDLPHHYDSFHVNVCAEAINYTPVSLKQIIRKGFKGIKDIHDNPKRKRN